MKKCLFASVLLLSSNCFAHTSSYPKNIEGNYNCTGTEYDTNKAFKCEVSIKKTGQTYALNTTCNDGTTYTSTGIYDYNKHNLSLVSVNPKNSAETGVGVVDVKKDGSMTSVWTYLNKTTLGHTQCSKSIRK